MRLVSSYEPNFFSVEDIIATNSTVPCRVEIKIPRLGEKVFVYFWFSIKLTNFLNASVGEMDRGSQSEHLEPGRRLELPLWLAFNLSKRHLIKPDFSKAYNTSARLVFLLIFLFQNYHWIFFHFREILKAEPNVVDLLKQEPYFYETGIHVSSLVAGEDDGNIKTVLQNVLNP